MRISGLKRVSHTELVDLFNEVYRDYFWTVSHTSDSLAETITYMNINPELSAILWIEERPCGFALVASYKQSCWLYSLGVLPQHRGQGYGKMVLEHILMKAQQAGMESMGLEVLLQNTIPRRLYRAYGFQRCCLLDSFEMGERRLVNIPNQWEYRELRSEEARRVWLHLQPSRESSVVWSLRLETLMRRSIKWVALYQGQQVLGLLAYANEDPTMYYRLIIGEQQNYLEVGQGLLTWVGGQSTQGQYMVNVKSVDQELRRLLLNLGFKRFMQQEYLTNDLSRLNNGDSTL